MQLSSVLCKYNIYRVSHPLHAFVCLVRIKAGERPWITNAGSQTVVQAGHDVQFTCEAYGTPQPFILWYKDHSILDQQRSRSFPLYTSLCPVLYAPCIRHVDRKRHMHGATALPPKKTCLLVPNKFIWWILLISFATDVPPKCQNWGTNAALFCTLVIIHKIAHSLVFQYWTVAHRDFWLFKPCKWSYLLTFLLILSTYKRLFVSTFELCSVSAIAAYDQDEERWKWRR